jgi:hypothetical protein
MSTTIQNKDIQGPPFGCPECAAEGTRTTFNGRGALGSHRFSVHEVSGTSTGSRAYKTGKLSHKTATTTRKYIKRTPQVSPLMAMLNNPTEFVSVLDSMISEKNGEINSLYEQISTLKNAVLLLQRYRSTFAPEAVPEVQSPYATVA